MFQMNLYIFLGISLFKVSHNVRAGLSKPLQLKAQDVGLIPDLILPIL